ncbi:MAG: DUF111 family protein, partial [Candidatus Dormibacteraeota bacterium]|nr:DUF111 family protein [Candidatus Dormibacteraeota bacterium]
MTIAYFDCFAGISGDMVLGALVDAGGDRTCIDFAVDALGLRGEVEVEVRREQRGHVGGARVVLTTRDGTSRNVAGLRAAIEKAEMPEHVRTQARAAIDLLAAVEGSLHDEDEAHLHLHELGGADTLVDIVGAFWLLHSM